MTFDLFKKIIDEYIQVNPQAAATRTCDMHHFGDSLMHPNYGKLVRYATESGVYTSELNQSYSLKRQGDRSDS